MFAKLRFAEAGSQKSEVRTLVAPVFDLSNFLLLISGF